VLSAGSLSSRRFETGVLKGVPAVKEYIDKAFVEVRLDADDPANRKLLDSYGVRRYPSVLIVSPKDDQPDNFALIEPFAWNAMFGVPRSEFELEQLYTWQLQRVFDRAGRSNGRVRPTGADVGGCGS